MANSINIDLYNSKSEDGKSISKTIEFLLPYLNKPQSEFPHQQIKDWEKVQTEFCWVLKHADNFLPKAIYKQKYTPYLPASGNEKNIYYTK